MVSRAFVCFTIFLLAPLAETGAQSLRFGLIGGSAVTNDIRGINDTFPNNTDPFLGRYTFNLFDRTTSRSPIIGPSLEVDLPRNFSLEFNALYRKLTSTQTATFIYESGTAESVSFSADRAKTWEFPVLIKYTLPLARLRPYIEAGPSFRVWQEPLGAEPSKIGATAGVGVDFLWGRFKAGPLIRYTRWAADGVYPRRSTKPDQVELLGSISYATTDGSRAVAGRKVWLTLLGGLPLNKGLGAASLPPYGPFVDESQSYIAGLGFEVDLYRRLSLDINALYRPIHARSLGYTLDGTQVRGDEFTVLTWPLPILAKYHIADRKYAPFIEAGPSFRFSGNKNAYEPSSFGISAGTGLQIRAGRMRLSPTLRYTRWKNGEASRFSRTANDQFDLLFAFSF